MTITTTVPYKSKVIVIGLIGRVYISLGKIKMQDQTT